MDRRVTPRYKISLDILQAREFGVEGLQDVSEYGFQLTTRENPVLGSMIELTTKFPNGDTVTIEGRIVWKKPRATDDGQVQDVGVLLMNGKDSVRYRELVAGSPNRVVVPERRHKERRDRRAKNISDRPPAERRRGDRRGSESIKRRVELASHTLDRWIANNTYERVMESSAGPIVKYRGRDLINLASNSYLGLTEHPQVKEAAIKAIEKYGVGSGGVRYLSGTLDIHQELEEKLARFKGTEACKVFPAGYVANLSVLIGLLEEGDVVLNDFLNHASIVDGCRASGATSHFYRHGDLDGLERRLRRYAASKGKLIITDGVFSMDGDVAPLKEIVALGKKYNANVMVDDAHATGVIGAKGRGTAEHCGVYGQVDITIVTLSKALGASGGAVCGSRSLIKYIFQRSRPFIFTSSFPPSICASVMASLDVIESEPELVANLHRNQKFLCTGLQEMGYDAVDTPSALIPVMLGPSKTAFELTRLLAELGVFTNAATEPGVPKDMARLRVSVMATQTLEHLQTALDCFQKAGKQLGLIP